MCTLIIKYKITLRFGNHLHKSTDMIYVFAFVFFICQSKTGLFFSIFRVYQILMFICVYFTWCIEQIIRIKNVVPALISSESLTLHDLSIGLEHNNDNNNNWFNCWWFKSCIFYEYLF